MTFIPTSQPPRAVPQMTMVGPLRALLSPCDMLHTYAHTQHTRTHALHTHTLNISPPHPTPVPFCPQARSTWGRGFPQCPSLVPRLSCLCRTRAPIGNPGDVIFPSSTPTPDQRCPWRAAWDSPNLSWAQLSRQPRVLLQTLRLWQQPHSFLDRPEVWQ